MRMKRLCFFALWMYHNILNKKLQFFLHLYLLHRNNTDLPNGVFSLLMIRFQHLVHIHKFCWLLHKIIFQFFKFTNAFFFKIFYTVNHRGHLAFSCILPTTERIGDLHPLEMCAARHTAKMPRESFLSRGRLLQADSFYS